MDQVKDTNKTLKTKLNEPVKLFENSEVIYETYIRQVFGYVHNRTGNVIDAEDITSQIFLSVLESLPNYKDNGHFAAWLFTIARRKVIDHYRKKKPVSSLDENVFTLSSEDMVNSCIRQERMRALKKVLGNLSEKEKELIRLRIVAELKFADIAKILKRSESAVKKSYYRLIERMKKHLEVSNG